MKEDFYGYLVDIGITKAYGKRIKEIYDFYEKLCPETIENIFVTEYITEDQLREYENLWFFSKSYVMEAKRFIKGDSFDICPISKIKRWEISKTDYDFIKANNKSRIKTTCYLDIDEVLYFRASGENCDYFKDIFYKYIKPNLMR